MCTITVFTIEDLSKWRVNTHGSDTRNASLNCQGLHSPNSVSTYETNPHIQTHTPVISSFPFNPLLLLLFVCAFPPSVSMATRLHCTKSPGWRVRSQAFPLALCLSSLALSSSPWVALLNPTLLFPSLTTLFLHFYVFQLLAPFL